MYLKINDHIFKNVVPKSRTSAIFRKDYRRQSLAVDAILAQNLISFIRIKYKLPPTDSYTLQWTFG